MLIPDLLNILFDQSDYYALVVLASLKKRCTVYANKYSMLSHYDVFDKTIVKNIRNICKFGKMKLAKHNDDYDHCCLHLPKISIRLNIGYEVCACKCSPLLNCIAGGHVNMVKYFIGVGVNVNQRADIALRFCSRMLVGKQQTEIIKYLASVGADINVHNGYVLKWCAHDDNLDAVKFLVNIGADDMGIELALLWSVKRGHLNIVKHLVGIDSNINAYSGLALVEAASFGQLEIVEYLLSIGINDRADIDGAFLTAVSNNCPDIVMSLVKAGANIHTGNDFALRRYRAFGQTWLGAIFDL